MLGDFYLLFSDSVAALDQIKRIQRALREARKETHQA